MRILLSKTFKENLVTLLWFGGLLLFLSLKTGPPGTTGSLLGGALQYWQGHAAILFSALGHTLSVALPASVVILLISFSTALLAANKPRLTSSLTAIIILISLLPSVYLVHLVRIIHPLAQVNSEAFAGGVLIFSNLVMYFFFLGFKKDISDEFAKEYHFLARQLGVKSKFRSSLQKLGLLGLERFLPLFIMVFSSTIFVEEKLNISGGIYTSLYDTVKSVNISSRPDIFWGKLLFILIFVVSLQFIYGIILNHVKTRYF